MDREELARLPVLLDVPEAGRVLGIGRSLAYELVRRGEWPTAVVRVGRLIKIPSGPLLRLVEAGPVDLRPVRAASGTESVPL